MSGLFGDIGSIFGSILGYNNAQNNLPQQLNISSVISQAQTQAANDLQNSLNLEQQYLPGQAALRASSNTLNQNISSGNTTPQTLQNLLLGQGSSPIVSAGQYVNNPLSTAANTSIQQSLAMGGQLDPSTQAMITQGALQGAGTAGISGSGAGRGLVARDLGLTSMQVLQGRQNQASAAGNAFGQLGLQGQSLQLQDYISRLTGANSAVASQNSYGLGLGNLMNNTALPNSGLTGSQVASLDVGNQQIANAARQQSAANTSSLYNSLFGAAGNAADYLTTNNGSGSPLGNFLWSL